MESKKLYKSRTDTKIDGVCGGLAKYFNMDPTIVRIIWIVICMLGGSGILAYIICMIVIPREPEMPDYAGSGNNGQYHN